MSLGNGNLPKLHLVEIFIFIRKLHLLRNIQVKIFWIQFKLLIHILDSDIYILPPVQPTLRNKSDFGENNFFYFFLTKIHGFDQIIWKESMILFKSLLQSGSLKKMFFLSKSFSNVNSFTGSWILKEYTFRAYSHKVI